LATFHRPQAKAAGEGVAAVVVADLLLPLLPPSPSSYFLLALLLEKKRVKVSGWRERENERLKCGKVLGMKREVGRSKHIGGGSAKTKSAGLFVGRGSVGADGRGLSGQYVYYTNKSVSSALKDHNFGNIFFHFSSFFFF
jgi:hypothetical protein